VSLSLRADDAQAVCDQLKSHGVTILADPFDTPFGKTFVFKDPDGYAVAVHGAT
jgi:predicted enzyme related to lactoylglutathione lyase